MRVLLAPDAVDGATAVDAAAELAAGWRAARPADSVATHPLSTGGAGHLDAVRSALGGETRTAVVRGPRGASVPTSWLRVGATAYLDTLALRTETSDAVDLVRHGSSAGLGDLVRAALVDGVRRVVVGVGEVAVHDAGAGALRAVAELPDDAPPDDAVRAAARALATVEVVVAAASDLPLVGLSGSGAALARRPGLDGELAQQREGELQPTVARMEAAHEPPTSLGLAGGAPVERRLARRPYAGAGGGIAFALACAGARVLPGPDVVAAETALAAAVAGADLVVTAAEQLDGGALATGVPGTVGRLALAALVPGVVVASTVLVSRRDLAGTGLDAVYPVTDAPRPGVGGDAAVVAESGGTPLSRRASRIARTWSR